MKKRELFLSYASEKSYNKDDDKYKKKKNDAY